jgi:hypothetical protein
LKLICHGLGYLQLLLQRRHIVTAPLSHLIDSLVRFRQLPRQLHISLRSLFFQPLFRYQALRLGRFVYHAFHLRHNLLHPFILP